MFERNNHGWYIAPITEAVRDYAQGDAKKVVGGAFGRFLSERSIDFQYNSANAHATKIGGYWDTEPYAIKTDAASFMVKGDQDEKTWRVIGNFAVADAIILLGVTYRTGLLVYRNLLSLDEFLKGVTPYDG